VGPDLVRTLLAVTSNSVRTRFEPTRAEAHTRLKIKVPLVPPKPKELDITVSSFT